MEKIMTFYLILPLVLVWSEQLCANRERKEEIRSTWDLLVRSSIYGGNTTFKQRDQTDCDGSTLTWFFIDEMSNIARTLRNEGKTFGNIVNRPDNDSMADIPLPIGLTLTVYHESTGSLMLKRTFPTYLTYAHGFDLIWWLTRLQEGRLVVLSISFDGIRGLFWVKEHLESMGSRLISHAPTSSKWIWVWRAGGATILETLNPEFNSFLTVHSTMMLLAENIKYNELQKTTSMSLHEKLCSKLESLGSYCNSTEYRNLITRIERRSAINDDFKVGIMIFAGVRAQYLIETIMSIFRCPEVNSEDIMVTIGKSFFTKSVNEDILSLVEDLKLRYRIIQSYSSQNETADKFLESAHFYRSSIAIAVDEFHDRDYIAFVDEDVLVTRDWMSYLRYAAPILRTDPSLWCVSPSGGVRVTGGDPRLLLRGQKEPGYGFIMTRESVDDAVSHMKPGDRSFYDLWLLNYMKGKECVFSELARSRHFGVGINTLPEVIHFYSLKVDIHDGSPVKFTPLENLTKNNYSNQIIYDLQHAKPHFRDPCKPYFFSTTTVLTNQVYAFAYIMRYSDYISEWYRIASCIGAYPHTVMNQHNNTVRFSLDNNQTLLLVGVPQSSFSQYLRIDVPIWGLDKEFVRNFSAPPHPLNNFTLHTSENVIESNFVTD